MSGFLCPGPVEIWAGVGGGNEPNLVGFSRRGLNVEDVYTSEPVVCDRYGTSSADETEAGLDWLISGEIIMPQMSTIMVLRDRAKPRFGRATPGVQLPSDLGSFLYMESGYRLWLRFQGGARPANNIPGNTLIPGYLFFMANTVQSSTPDLGPRALVTRITWRAKRLLDATNTFGFGFGALIGYNFDLSALAGLVAT